MFAEKFNEFVEPKDLKSAYKLFYLIGTGITLLGFTQAWFQKDPVVGASFVAVGQMMVGLAFDYRNERTETGFDELKETVEELQTRIEDLEE